MSAMLSLTMFRLSNSASASGEKRTCGHGVLVSYVDCLLYVLLCLNEFIQGHSWRMSGDSTYVALSVLVQPGMTRYRHQPNLEVHKIDHE